MRIPTLSILIATGASLGALAADPAPDTPLVTKGDVAVTVEDFNAAMSRVPEGDRFEFRASMERIKKTVDALYISRMLARDARAEGLDKDELLRRRIQIQEEQILAAAYLEKFESSIKVPDFEQRAKELYLASPSRYAVPERVKLRYILVDKQGRTPEEALKRATEARNRLLADENYFAIAKEYSNDPSFRANQGEIGPAPYKDLPERIAAVARNMKKPGEVSELLDLPEGYGIVVFVERLEPTVISFDKAKKQLIKELEVNYKREVMDRKFGEITARKDVIIYTDNIAALKTEPDEKQIKEMHDRAAGRLPASK